MKNKLFSLLQICDSNFPSGAFAHSFGFETYIQEGTVSDKKTFLHALTQYLKVQCIFTDGLACRLAFQAAESKQLNLIWKIDQELYVLANAKEIREGNKRIGQQLLKVMTELFKSELFQTYQSRIKAKQQHGHSAIVFAIVGHILKISLEDTLSVYLFAVASSLVQNGVRGIPLGQTTGQVLLNELQPILATQVEKILMLNEDDFGGSTPGLEISQMKHEELSVRLFMS